MKKKLNLIIFVLISMFAFSMSAKAYSCKADGNECEIKTSAAEGSLKNCTVVSGNFSARFDSSTKTCYVKSNVISQSGFLGTIKLEKVPGAYGAGGTYEANVQFTSAGGTGESNVTEKVANGTFQPDGSWTNVSSYVTGAITSCTIKSGAAKLDTSNHGCKVSSNQSGDVVLKVVHTSVGAIWTTYVTFNYGTAAGGGTGIDTTIDNRGEKKETDDPTLANVADALQICDEKENPKVVASCRLVGIFVTIIKIVAPIVIIVMGMFDLSKAVIEGKDDSIKKQAISFLRRSIACILIFFVPTIMLALFHYIDGWDNVKGQFSTCIDCILGSNKCPNVGFGAGQTTTPQIGDEAIKGHNGMPSDVELNMYKNK